jgi:hypothetical protein
MSFYQIHRLTRLHERAERLSAERSSQSKALWHLQKAERLYFEISGRIRDFVSPPTDPEGVSRILLSRTAELTNGELEQGMTSITGTGKVLQSKKDMSYNSQTSS